MEIFPNKMETFPNEMETFPKKMKILPNEMETFSNKMEIHCQSQWKYLERYIVLMEHSLREKSKS